MLAMFLGLQETVTMTAMTTTGSTPWTEKNKVLPKHRVTLNLLQRGIKC